MADEVTRLRIGTVSAVDKANLAARVIFKDENIVSGWLPVLQRTGEIVTVATAGKHDHDVDGDCTVKIPPKRRPHGQTVRARCIPAMKPPTVMGPR